MTERVRIGSTILAAESIGIEINYKPYAEMMINDQDPPRPLIAALAHEAYRVESLAREMSLEEPAPDLFLEALRKKAFEMIPRPDIDRLVKSNLREMKGNEQVGNWNMDYCDTPWTYLTDYRGFQLHARFASYANQKGTQYMITKLNGDFVCNSELFPLDSPQVAVRTGLIDIEQRYERQKEKSRN